MTVWNVAAALTASHSKPWGSSEDHERFDANNGLPLAALLGRLFDLHLIAFEPETGKMQGAVSIDEANRAILNIPGSLRQTLNEGRRILFISIWKFLEKVKRATLSWPGGRKHRWFELSIK
jgi:hypothetical protein